MSLPRSPRIAVTAALLLASSALAVISQEAPSDATAPPTSFGYVDAGCNTSYPDHISLFRSDGSGVPDLYFCATTDRRFTEIINTSSSKVWYLTSPETVHYWSTAQDAYWPLRVRLFRAALRRYFRGQTPRLTSEPHTWLTVSASPPQIRLDQDPGEQLIWRTVSTGVTTISKKAPGWAVDVLGYRSPSRKALLTCAVSGYKAAQKIDAYNSPADALRTTYGVYGDVTTCSRAIRRAEQKTADERLALTADDVERTTMRASWETHVDSGFYRALRALLVSRFRP